jgi:hypothetical protein
MVLRGIAPLSRVQVEEKPHLVFVSCCIVCDWHRDFKVEVAATLESTLDSNSVVKYAADSVADGHHADNC